MRTYIINLRRRADRRARMEGLLPPGLDAVFTSDWSGPFDGHDIGRESLQGFDVFPRWQIESANRYWSRPLKKGEVGGSISHWRCWQDAFQRNEDKALFFEDDVALADSFLGKLSAAIQTLEDRHSRWDLLYLGRFHSKPALPRLFVTDIPLDQGLVQPGFSYGAHAYMLSRSGLRKVLSVHFERAIIPIDEFLPALYVIHPRPDVARMYRPFLNAFAAQPQLVTHLPLDHFGSDAEASEFVDWTD